MALVSKSTRSTQFVVWGLALVLVLLGVYAVRSLTRERITVRVAQVSYGDLSRSFSTTGKVEPMNDFQVHAQAAGQVQGIYVDLGDKVKAGQLLIKMDDKYALANLAHANSTLQAAQLTSGDIQHGGTQDERNSFAADLSRAKLQRQQDAASLTSLQQLQQKGAASAAEVAAAEHRVQVDDSNLGTIEQHSTQRYGQADQARAQAELADARAAVVAAQSGYATANIRSKIAGTVYYIPVAQYDYVSTGEDLVYVADLSRMHITAYFDEPDIGSLAAGQSVAITWEAKRGATWHGHIIQPPTIVINYQQRFVGECIITVDDGSGTLDPNANVIVTVTTAQNKHVLEVPHSALKQDASGYFVYRVIQNKLVLTRIKTGIINLNEVEITSGLTEGDIVATTPTINRDLTNGLEVTPVQ